MNLSRVFRDRSVASLVELSFRRLFGVLTSKTRLLPDFIIIGAQRAGTTSLFKYLCQHPDIHPSFPKEIHYFTNYFHKGNDWYRSHFPLKKEQTNSTRAGDQGFLTGEATPYYLFHPLAPGRAVQIVPDVRLILLLRNPVDRAYSHYHHEVHMGVEELSFEEALEAEKERLRDEKSKLETLENYLSFNFQHFSYFSRGLYVNQIRAWKKFFPEESILILLSENLDADPQKCLKQVTDFLELPHFDQYCFNRYNSRQYLPIETATKIKLQKEYRPYNRMLSDFIQMDLSWD